MNQLVEDHKWARLRTGELVEAANRCSRGHSGSAKVTRTLELLVEFYPRHIEQSTTTSSSRRSATSPGGAGTNGRRVCGIRALPDSRRVPQGRRGPASPGTRRTGRRSPTASGSIPLAALVTKETPMPQQRTAQAIMGPPDDRRGRRAPSARIRQQAGRLFDPFLMLDDFRLPIRRSSEPASPGILTAASRRSPRAARRHRARGQHRQPGVIGSGDMQWMTAGSGIIHQEMPQGDARGQMGGFQLWANLPSRTR